MGYHGNMMILFWDVMKHCIAVTVCGYPPCKGPLAEHIVNAVHVSVCA